MITETMSDEEIHKEVQRDRYEVHNYMEKIVSRYRHTIVTTPQCQFPLYFPPVTFTSHRENKYLVFFEIRDKKNWLENLLCTIVSLYDNNGIYAITFSVAFDKLYLYSPHFFSRYRTRFLKDENIKPIDVVKRFFKINPTTQFRTGEGDEFYGTCNEGAVFGKKEGNRFIFKTFVSFDMLFESQNDIKTELYDRLIKYRAEIQ